MRKLLILLLLVPMVAKAQVGEYRSDFAVGVNGGYMMSQVSFQPEVPQGWLGGMTGGVSFRYTCEKYFKSICAIVAEVNYAQMGWKETIEDKDNNPVYYPGDENKENPLYYERRINYIQIPVMADESTNTNIEPNRGTVTPRSSVVTAQEDMPVENKFDYGIVGGAGIEFSLPKIGDILLDARYYFGLGNIYGNSKQDYFGKSNQQAIVIKMSYLYDIFKTKNSNIK